MRLYDTRAEIFNCMMYQGFLDGKLEMLKYDFLGGFSLLIEIEIDEFIDKNFVLVGEGVA